MKSWLKELATRCHSAGSGTDGSGKYVSVLPRAKANETAEYSMDRTNSLLTTYLLRGTGIEYNGSRREYSNGPKFAIYTNMDQPTQAAFQKTILKMAKATEKNQDPELLVKEFRGMSATEKATYLKTFIDGLELDSITEKKPKSENDTANTTVTTVNGEEMPVSYAQQRIPPMYVAIAFALLIWILWDA